MIDYVCGFCFDPAGKQIVLIKKNRPEWQKGLLNGVGGKVEEGEQHREAIQREFLEETGVKIENWELFCVYQGKDYVVHFFKTFSLEYDKIESKTDEHVSVYEIDFLNSSDVLRWTKNKTIDNLKWLIPLALDTRIDTVACFEK